MRKLVSALACRNKGSRLYGKPLQNLDIDNEISILDNIVSCLRSIDVIDDIVLGIAEGCENDDYVEYANKNNLGFIRGNEIDVLGRLIQCGEYANATEIFRSTSESPFPSFDLVATSWEKHVSGNFDATFLDNTIDGCNFEIISLAALKKSHSEGQDKHRSELCTLFIRENKDDFRIEFINPDDKLVRRDLRLTVDYPEDLIVCRAIYSELNHLAPSIPLPDIVDFLDSRPDLKKLIAPFCEEGYETMYL